MFDSDRQNALKFIKYIKMVLLTCEGKIEIVLIVGEKYKTHREAAIIFNDSHPIKILIIQLL